MRSVFLICIISAWILSSCKDNDQNGSHDQTTDAESKIPVKDALPQTKKLIKKSFKIGDSLHLTDLNNFKHFGSFFQGRAIYYHNYEDTIYHGNSANGKELLLCFFDHQIARMKYQVDRDIASELMQKHGSFRIKPLDSLSQILVKSGNILIRNNKQISLHQDIKNYELTWQKTDKQIVFRRSENFGSVQSFVYEERIPDYKESMIYLTRY